MSFVDDLEPSHRSLFEQAGAPLSLDRGQYLLRRGEPGGDLYLLRKGSLEVVDTRTTPEVILAVLGEGTMVGEMAFLDDSPRSADVRASAPTEVTRWQRDDLRALLGRNPPFSAIFYRKLAQVAANRIRALTTNAVAGALTQRDTPNTVGLAAVRDEARTVAEVAKEGFIEAETRLRTNPEDALGHARLAALLEQLQADLLNVFTAHPEPEVAKVAAKALCRELHPYLVRSSLAERCIRRPQGVTGTAEILAHVMVNAEGGDGQVGELLDRWLLDRPTLRALRALRDPTVEYAVAALPAHRNRRILLLNAGTGSLVAGLTARLSHPPTVLTVVDQSRDALAFLDAGVTIRPRGVDLQTVQENLAQFALGRYRHSFPPQDVIILHGLIEYMPERIVVSLLTAARQLLAAGGTVLASALAPSPDQYLLDRLLTWPTIRRSPEAFHALFEAADLRVEQPSGIAAPALLLAGVRDLSMVG